MILPARVNRAFAVISAFALVASSVLMSAPLELFTGATAATGSVLMLN